MKKILTNRVRLTILIVVVLFVVTGTVAAGGGLGVSRFVIGGGGGHAETGRYAMDASIGQAVAGTFDIATTEICAGFWCGLGVYNVYLPIIMRS